MNILKGLLFLQKSSIVNVRLGYIQTSKNIDVLDQIIAIVTTHSVFLFSI